MEKTNTEAYEERKGKEGRKERRKDERKRRVAGERGKTLLPVELRPQEALGRDLVPKISLAFRVLARWLQRTIYRQIVIIQLCVKYWKIRK
jgi:hypothetical protein